MSKEYTAVHVFPSEGVSMFELIHREIHHPIAKPLLENLIERGAVAKDHPHRFAKGLEYRYFIVYPEPGQGVLICQWRQQKKRRKSPTPTPAPDPPSQPLQD